MTGPIEGEVYDASGRPIGGGAATRQQSATRARTWMRTGASTGLSMGSALAIVISWSLHQSILWAIIHGFLGWVYVVWYAITR